jgi:hypothetical protein
MREIAQKSGNEPKEPSPLTFVRRPPSVSAVAWLFMPLPAGFHRQLVDLPPSVPHPSTLKDFLMISNISLKNTIPPYTRVLRTVYPSIVKKLILRSCVVQFTQLLRYYPFIFILFLFLNASVYSYTIFILYIQILYFYLVSHGQRSKDCTISLSI